LSVFERADCSEPARVLTVVGAGERLPAHARDARGRNWDMKAFGNAAGYERSIRAVVDKARDEFDLIEVPGQQSADPFGTPPSLE